MHPVLASQIVPCIEFKLFNTAPGTSCKDAVDFSALKNNWAPDRWASMQMNGGRLKYTFFYTGQCEEEATVTLKSSRDLRASQIAFFLPNGQMIVLI